MEEAPFSLSLLKCVAAGDYRWLEISPEGEARSLRAGRGLRVLESRQGRLDPMEIQRLRHLLPASGLSSLQAHYPPQAQPGVEVEDVYYALALAAAGGGSRSLVAHEASLPRSLSPLVLALEQVAAALPPSTPGSSWIVALPVETLICLGEDAESVDVLAPGLGKARDYLRSAVRSQGHAVGVPPEDLPLVQERLFRGNPLIRLHEDGRELALLLLRR